MDHLPDDVLVMVMSRLDLPDLFSCRLVCKRFASLALHPDVWRDRCLPEPFTPAEAYNTWFCPVLRLAPCLALLTTSLPPCRACHPLFTSACAAMRLDLYVFEGGASHAALLIRHHRELGRLKGVELHFEKTPSKEDAALLFQTLAATPGMDYLEIDLQCRKLPLDCSPRSLLPTAPASLRSFTCPLDTSLVHFFNIMLTGHAATLQEVCIVNYDVVPEPSTTALLLAQMPNLTYLQCPIFPEMQTLAACASLRSLCLEIYPSEADADAKAAAALLRRAHQLTKVNLRHVCYDPDVQGPGVELIVALASSGRSGVEELSIGHQFPERTTTLPLLRELRRAAPYLPALRRLKVNLPRDDITSEVEELLAVKPSLHVEFAS